MRWYNAGYWVITKNKRALQDGKPVGSTTSHVVYKSYNYDQAAEWLHNMPPDQPHEWYVITSDRTAVRIK